MVKYIKKFLSDLTLCRVNCLQPLATLLMEVCRCPYVLTHSKSKVITLPTISTLNAKLKRRSSMSVLKAMTQTCLDNIQELSTESPLELSIQLLEQSL